MNPIIKCTAAAALLLLATAAAAQDMPGRKAGLWEMEMQMQGMPGGGMKSQQCVDPKTDADLQRRAMQGGRNDVKCTQKSLKRLANGVEVEADCTSSEGRQHILTRATGDFSKSYTVDSHVTFDPPRHGMSEATMKISATHAGACPAGMSPGQVRMAGMPGFDPKAMQGMTPEQLQKMAEEMKKNAGR